MLNFGFIFSLCLVICLPNRLCNGRAVSTTRLFGRRPNLEVKTFGKGTGAELNQQILSIFNSLGNEDGPLKMKKLKDLVMENSDRANHVHGVTILQRAAKNKQNILGYFSEDIILSLLRKNGHGDGEPWKAYEIGQSLYGCRMLNIERKGAKELLSLLIEKIEEHSRTEASFTGQDIASCFFGLQNLAYKQGADGRKLINKLLRALVLKLSECTDKLSSQEISNILYGLRLMNHVDNPPVLDVLTVLVGKIKEAEPLAFTSQGVSFCLNGLQGLTAELPQVEAILRVLSAHILTTTDNMKIIGIGSAMMGLRSMSAESAHVREILGRIATSLESMTLPNKHSAALEHTSIAAAFNGLYRMNDSIVEVKSVVAALNKRIEASLESEIYTPASIAVILNSMRQMSLEHAETRRTLALMSIKMDMLNSKFTLAEVALASSGLCSCKLVSSEVLGIFARLASRLLQSRVSTYPDDPQDQLKDIANIAYGLQYKASKAGEHVEIRGMLNAIGTKLQGLSAISSRNKDLNDFNAQTLSLVMLGIQKADTDLPEVKRILESLRIMMGRRPWGKTFKGVGCLDGYVVSSTLKSMNGMSSECKQVRAFLAALADVMKHDREERERAGTSLQLNSKEICNSFFGFMNFNSIHQEVLAVLQELLFISRHVPDANDSDQFTSRGLGFALTGFQTMSSEDSALVVEALGMMADKIDSLGPAIMAPGDLANAIFGLQGMTATQEEVRAVLAALTPRMEQSTEIFTPRDISFCLTGLAQMQQSMQLNVPEVGELLAEINIKVSRSSLKGLPNLQIKTYGTGGKIIPI